MGMKSYPASVCIQNDIDTQTPSFLEMLMDRVGIKQNL